MRQTACARRSLADMIDGGTRGREPHVRHQAAGLRSAARQRGGRVAACRTRQQSADAGNRFPGDDHGAGLDAMDRCIRAAAARAWLDRGPHRDDRVSLGGEPPRALCRDRGRIRPAQGRCHLHGWSPKHPRGKTGDIGRSDRLCACEQPCQQRPGCKLGATGRQRHRSVDAGDRYRGKAARTHGRTCPIFAVGRSCSMQAFPTR